MGARLGQRLSDLERESEEPSEEQSHLVDEIEAILHTDEAGNQHAITPGR